MMALFRSKLSPRVRKTTFNRTQVMIISTAWPKSTNISISIILVFYTNPGLALNSLLSRLKASPSNKAGTIKKLSAASSRSILIFAISVEPSWFQIHCLLSLNRKKATKKQRIKLKLIPAHLTMLQVFQEMRRLVESSDLFKAFGTSMEITQYLKQISPQIKLFMQ